MLTGDREQWADVKQPICPPMDRESATAFFKDRIVQGVFTSLCQQMALATQLSPLSTYIYIIIG